eukprot:CAMPEP_0185032002 /NCGR_PEP_ID=MMETSP1103-20130426/19814_1 /TAXON_ID=36769 /ORGANISM="Paraphysomonas bandaiensis, Strain Caron Lab Isolate" /LENGTH=300 /DNA_ID=CAMNT_0027567731 /DNA_START=188 /DNA_END=1090 /DNA_ORIENTATION=-
MYSYDYEACGIQYSNEWVPNSRNLLLHRQQLIPVEGYSGVVALCHGYGDHTLGFLTEIAINICKSGFAVIMMDAEGHGLSDGLHGHISDIMDITTDYSDYIMEQANRKIFRSKPFFLYGNSMGGAIAFNICTRCPARKVIEGVIMVAPMVKIADNMQPPKILTLILKALANIFPLAPITPVPSIPEKCFKNPEVLARALKCSLVYRMKPRLGTAVAMMKATEDIASRMHELKHPVLIQHGEADQVTCHKNSITLFEKCSSEDKTLKIYPGAWHSLVVGEYEPLSSEVFNDIVTWLRERCR